jgi:hypothetical protein
VVHAVRKEGEGFLRAGENWIRVALSEEPMWPRYVDQLRIPVDIDELTENLYSAARNLHDFRALLAYEYNARAFLAESGTDSDLYEHVESLLKTLKKYGAPHLRDGLWAS